MSSGQASSNDTDQRIVAEGPQVKKVTEISNDDEKLKKMVGEKLGYDVKIEEEWTECKDLDKADPSIRALLVKQECAWGAVRVDSDPVSNVVTGPGQGQDFYIVYIDPDQSCRFY